MQGYQEVVVYTEVEILRPAARALAEKLRLPFVDKLRPPTFFLNLTTEGLELSFIEREGKSPRGISVGFTTGPMLQLIKSAKKSQPLGQAIGPATSVIDATAGLGKDSLYLVSIGHNVLAIEKSPVIFSLLEDGYSRAVNNKRVGPMLSQRLKFVNEDSIRYLQNLTSAQCPDVIYLDPMYSGPKSSALPKKGMQLFRNFVSESVDDLKLFETATQKAKKRVVVKRPVAAPPLIEPVSLSFEGKMVRYDSYLMPQPASGYIKANL